MKKIFGLQRHKLLMGDRHESDIDVVGPYLCALFAVRAAMLADCTASIC
jgi:hypothetical protein